MPHEQIQPRQTPLPTPRTPADTGWFADYSELLSFASILVAADILTDVGDVLHYFEKPWSRDPEHEAWIASGRPVEPGEPAWDGFVIAATEAAY